MKQYKLSIDGQPSWTAFYIEAPSDRAARERASQIAVSYGPDAAFTLTRSGERRQQVVSAQLPDLRANEGLQALYR